MLRILPYKIFFLLIVCTGPFCSAQNKPKPLILVHYMPWFQTPSFHGSWGWHWTMNHYNPNSLDSSGHRSIASHYYPLSGPYDSDDPNILEYQTLLMKISGIDGVLVDWYGNDNVFDYGTLNTSAQNIFAAIQKASLLFGIVYEDQSIKHMIDGGYFNASQAYDHGRSALEYLENSWSGTASYLHFDNHPVLLVFGPQYFLRSTDWDSLFSKLRTSPLFITLDNRLTPAAVGSYPWPPMWKSNSSGILTQDVLNSYLASFYQQSAGAPYLITSAFPGFHDIYKEAGVGESYGFLDPLNGETFSSILHLAITHNPDVIQIATWNDYGEGTIVEPTAEFGYQYLDTLQSVKRGLDAAFGLKEEDLQWPLQILTLRLRFAGNSEIGSALNRVYSLIVSGRRDSINTILDSLSQITQMPPRPVLTPRRYGLQQNYPNPFNPATVIGYQLAVGSSITVQVYDELGREVATLVNGEQFAGSHSVRWDAARFPSGVYFYALNAGSYHEVKKMVLMK